MIKLKFILRKLIEKLKSLFIFNKNVKSSNIEDFFELDISWEDISWGYALDDSNVIHRAMKRNGLQGYVTSCLIVLDGCSYIPQELSSHWEAYHDSPKLKPVNIKYIKI